jgi:Nuclease-related domain
VALAVLPALAMLGLLCLIWPAWAQFYAGIAVGLAVSTYLWVLDSPPEWIERKRRGRDGERRTERELRALEKDGWVIAHDIDAGYGNFDHVVIGPSGAYLLETKALQGRVAFDERGMVVRRGGYERDDWRPSFEAIAKRSAARAKGLLAPSGIRFVRPIVVLWCEFDEGIVERDGVAFVTGKRLVGWLSEQDDHRLPPAVLERARTILSDSLAA